MKTEIKMDGNYQTLGGCKVRRVLCIDRINDIFPVVVELENGAVFQLTKFGAFFEGAEDRRDLVEVKPLHETLKVDDKVMVREGSSDSWHKRYYSHFFKSADSRGWLYAAFANGGSSWTTDEITIWNECRLPTPEELEGKA